MATDAVMQFTDDNFESEVLGASEPVLVDFWAEWCQPCKMLLPTIDELANDYEGRAKIGKVDTDSNIDVSVKYGVTAIPTILVFKGGEVAKKFVGMTSKDQLTSAIDELL